ncbi:MAG: cytochrome P450 [Vulcanimicrobiota bacterium]
MSADLLARFRDQMQRNPYPVYHLLRKLDPVHWSESWGAWFLTGYADIASLKKDDRFSVGRVSDFTKRLGIEGLDLSAVERRLSSWLLFMDPPRHDQLRALVAKVFTPKSLSRMEGIVAARVDHLLDPVGPGQADLLAVLASPLPVLTIADILGAPPEEVASFEGWSHDLVSFLGSDGPAPEVVVQGAASLAAMEAYFTELIAQRRSQPADDLLSDLLAVEGLQDDDILGLATLLFAAGHDTTTNLIGNGLLALLEHPEQTARLVAEPERMAAVLEEVLRYDGPSQITSRYATEDVEVAGKLVRAGQCVNLCIGAANRDPSQFAEPDRFDIDRAATRHLAFGIGIHFCLGAFLARMEARAAWQGVLRRWPSARLATRPSHYPSVGFRRLRALEVEL